MRLLRAVTQRGIAPCLEHKGIRVFARAVLTNHDDIGCDIESRLDVPVVGIRRDLRPTNHITVSVVLVTRRGQRVDRCAGPRTNLQRLSS